VTDQPDRAAWLTVHAQLDATDLTPVLPTSGEPTLVLCGGRDRASQPDARRTAQAIAGARLVVNPHIGHLLPPRALDYRQGVLPDALTSGWSQSVVATLPDIRIRGWREGVVGVGKR